MLFNSVEFLIFFPLVLAVYFIVPRRWRYLWLLMASYYFYMSWSPQYAILIAISTAVTYSSGRAIDATNRRYGDADAARCKRAKRWIVALSLLVNLGILFFFKYGTFIQDNLNAVLRRLHMRQIDRTFDVLLPVGISFYTFQALSYTIDAYRGNTKIEKNFFRYTLFVSFFPQLVAGPIERSKNLLTQVSQVESFRLWDWRRITDGLKIMLYGYFVKLVVADRVAPYVNEVFSNYNGYNSIAIIVACIFFAIQIYCDFAGYSLIAIGSAKVLGFSLMENFNAPYLARSVAEFWRRWHISLSSWFRDYLYIPLGGNRCSKWRNALNVMIAFLASGLWHGANWTFAIWGVLNGLYQLIGGWLRPLKDRINKACHTRTDCFSYRAMQTVVTFILIDFSWIFFRASSPWSAFQIIKRVFTRMDLWSLANGEFLTNILSAGIRPNELVLALVGIVIVAVVDILKKRTGKELHVLLDTQCVWFRWGVYLVMLAMIAVFGVYGGQFESVDFIYFQF